MNVQNRFPNPPTRRALRAPRPGRPACRPGRDPFLPERLEGRVLFSTYAVLNLLDHGPGSLRQAVLNANGHPGIDAITFAPSVIGTITLTTGQITVTGGVQIAGPGASVLAVSGNNSTRIFKITAGPLSPVTIGGLTLTRANPGFADGGAVRNYGKLSLNGVVFTGNVATSFTTDFSDTHPFAVGGAGLMNYGTATVSGCAFHDNTVFAFDRDTLDGGGGIYNAGTLKVTHCAFYNNTATISPLAPQPFPATAPYPWGAAIYDNGTMTLSDSTLSDNESENGGGALAVGPYGSAKLVNDTIAGNHGQFAGGIYLQATPAFATGAAATHAGALSLGNTIVAGNTDRFSEADADVGGTPATDAALPGAGSVTSLGHNLIGVTSDTFWAASDLTGSVLTPLSAGLGPLANNGGPTKTRKLLIGSPAYNNGDNALAATFGLTTDQRYFPRVRGGTVDMGAFETT